MVLTFLSFAVPVLLWCAVSNIPWLWHPVVKVTDIGSIDYFVEGMEVPCAEFDRQVAQAKGEGRDVPHGYRVNPAYLPAPNEVVRAFYTAFATPLQLPNEPWLHQSLGHSAIIFIGTFFQQVLVIANTVRKVDPTLIEAAQTLGAKGRQLVTQVIVPAAIIRTPRKWSLMRSPSRLCR